MLPCIRLNTHSIFTTVSFENFDEKWCKPFQAASCPFSMEQIYLGVLRKITMSFT